MATSGDQGLAASPTNGLLRLVWTTGSSASSVGIGSGPSGLPMVADLRLRSTAGLLETMALLPEFSSNPPAIHFLKTSRSLSGSFLFGGIVGSSECVIAFQSLLPSGFPAITTCPDPPPLIVPLKLVRS